MSREYRLWAVTLATGLHVLEEHAMDWPAWAKEAFGLDVSWPDFYVTNAALVIGAVSGAQLGWRSPALSLGVPALAAINAIGFHIVPTVRQRRYSPGVVTASVLYLPTAFWAYHGAKRDGVLTGRTLVGSLLAGAALMAFPVALEKVKARGRALLPDAASDGSAASAGDGT